MEDRDSADFLLSTITRLATHHKSLASHTSRSFSANQARNLYHYHHRCALPGLYYCHRPSYPRCHHTNILQMLPQTITTEDGINALMNYNLDIIIMQGVNIVVINPLPLHYFQISIWFHLLCSKQEQTQTITTTGNSILLLIVYLLLICDSIVQLILPIVVVVIDWQLLLLPWLIVESLAPSLMQSAEHFTSIVISDIHILGNTAE